MVIEIIKFQNIRVNKGIDIKTQINVRVLLAAKNYNHHILMHYFCLLFSQA